MSRSRRLAYVALLLVLMAASGKRVLDRVTETPTERAYRERGLCAMGDDEIAALIENIQQGGLTREEELRLYGSTFGPHDEHAEACLPCVGAILDVAGGTGRG